MDVKKLPFAIFTEIDTIIPKQGEIEIQRLVKKLPRALKSVINRRPKI